MSNNPQQQKPEQQSQPYGHEVNREGRDKQQMSEDEKKKNMQQGDKSNR